MKGFSSLLLKHSFVTSYILWLFFFHLLLYFSYSLRNSTGLWLLVTFPSTRELCLLWLILANQILLSNLLLQPSISLLVDFGFFPLAVLSTLVLESIKQHCQFHPLSVWVMTFPAGNRVCGWDYSLGYLSPTWLYSHSLGIIFFPLCL